MALVYPLDYDAAGAALAERRRKEQDRKRADATRQQSARGPVAISRTYVGRREESRRTVEVFIGNEPPRKLDLARHSLDDLEWATDGTAPLQLAIAILSDATGNRRIALGYYRDFAREVVRELPWQEWRLTGEEIHEWLSRKAVAELEATLPPSRRRGARRMRHV